MKVGFVLKVVPTSFFNIKPQPVKLLTHRSLMDYGQEVFNKRY